MAESFKEVLSKAFKDTRHFFGWNKRSLIVPLFLIIGTIIHINRVGWEEAMNETGVWISYGLIPVGGFTILLFCWNLISSPYRLSKERETKYRSQLELFQNKFDKLENKLQHITEPILLIEHDDSPSYYHEWNYVPKFGDGMNYIPADVPAQFRKGRLCRISLYNLSKTESINNVKVKLVNIDPPMLKGKLPLHLHFQHDNVSPHQLSMNLNPEERIFIDVIERMQIGIIDNSNILFHITGSDPGVDARLPVRDYTIKVEVTAKNAPSISKQFSIGMKNKDNTKDKIWMWSVD